MNKIKLNTSPEAVGYVNGCNIIDENHALNLINVPGSMSRDINDYEITEEDGKEFLSFPGQRFLYISEEAIPDFDSSIKKVELTTGEASWYKLNGVENEIINIDLPERSSCYVYDKKGQIVYSSYMIGYGNSIPLPSYGMIVFVGETGSSVTIGR